MSRASGVALDELRPYLFLLRDRDATGHLLRVSGGLDSLVMGEGQILAQVKQVRACAPSERACVCMQVCGWWWVGGGVWVVEGSGGMVEMEGSGGEAVLAGGEEKG